MAPVVAEETTVGVHIDSLFGQVTWQSGLLIGRVSHGTCLCNQSPLSLRTRVIFRNSFEQHNRTKQLGFQVPGSA